MSDPPASTDKHLNALGIGKRKPAHDSWLLRDVNLGVGAGEIVAISGPSGSGKSLLLRVLAWLEPFDQGTLLWQGRELQAKDIPHYRSQVMYVRQTPALGEGTVLDCLRAPFAWHQHRGKTFERAEIQKSLEQLGKHMSLLDQDLETLSGGERQIVQILRALQLEPQVLLLDEPTAALDPESTHQVETLIEDWYRRHPDRSLVWVSHSPDQLRRLGLNHYQMQHGSLRPMSESSNAPSPR